MTDSTGGMASPAGEDPDSRTGADMNGSRFRLVVSDWSRLWLLLLAMLLPVAVVAAVVHAFSDGEWDRLVLNIGLLYGLCAVALLFLVAMVAGYVRVFLWMRAAFAPETWGMLVALCKGVVAIAFLGACIMTIWQQWGAVTWLEQDMQKERQSGKARDGTRLFYANSTKSLDQSGISLSTNIHEPDVGDQLPWHTATRPVSPSQEKIAKPWGLQSATSPRENSRRVGLLDGHMERSRMWQFPSIGAAT